MKTVLYISLTGLLLIFISCGVLPSKLKEAKEKGDDLLEKIANNNITDEFPKDEFTDGQVKQILNELNNNCKFDNKSGVFVNDVIENRNGTKYIHLVYEFPMECGNIRVMIMYLVMSGNLKLVGFGMEPTENENILILKPERQLKSQN